MRPGPKRRATKLKILHGEKNKDRINENEPVPPPGVPEPPPTLTGEARVEWDRMVALLDSMGILTNAARVLAERCVEGIEADAARCRSYAERTLGLATALNPYIGYLAAAAVAKEALATGRTLREVILERGLLTVRQLDQILDPMAMTEPRARLGDSE